MLVYPMVDIREMWMIYLGNQTVASWEMPHKWMFMAGEISFT